MIWNGKLSQAGHNIAVDGGASFSCMAVIALRGSYDGASGSFQRYRRAQSTGQPPSTDCDGDGSSNDGVVLT